ncbi:MAG: 6-carboxytetrahydropterin synthase QueD [Alphaproteobacteria bacterium]|uniref:6-carboxy-5,6,7,8-tetrahydropterin synthase n=1 Tax=Candidatus Nitrobium versatile TaxID=2884831 RepID=A0A953SDI4_9BACT|nr:6-carboxytetrahydropterin synthase QueD [Candidatus Nitrobium versatile]
MLELTVESNFSAAHKLNGYEGICKNIHGHNFTVEVTVRVKKLNKIGIGIDFLDLKQDIDSFLKQLDHKIINDISPFTKVNPTSENIAIWLYDSISKKVNSINIKVSKIKVKESSNFSATYYGKGKTK